MGIYHSFNPTMRNITATQPIRKCKTFLVFFHCSEYNLFNLFFMCACNAINVTLSVTSVKCVQHYKCWKQEKLQCCNPEMCGPTSEIDINSNWKNERRELRIPDVEPLQQTRVSVTLFREASHTTDIVCQAFQAGKRQKMILRILSWLFQMM